MSRLIGLSTDLDIVSGPHARPSPGIGPTNPDFDLSILAVDTGDQSSVHIPEWRQLLARCCWLRHRAGGARCRIPSKKQMDSMPKSKAIFDIMIADIEIQARVDEAIEEIADADRQQQLKLACRPSR